jgi:hypothetical protein
MSMERLFVARVLLTVATTGYGLLTVKADFNKTHATNPLWIGHARFHVVWQIASHAGFGAIALWLIWAPGEMAVERLYLASAFAVVAYGAFSSRSCACRSMAAARMMTTAICRLPSVA